jgi:ankyrin repeat domain-containing protein 50
VKRNCEATDGLAYFYFNFRHGNPGDSATCLRSLIAQLSKSGGDLPVVVQKLYTRHLVEDQLPDRFALVEVLLSLIRRQRNTFIVVDALDEAVGKEEFLEILSIIAKQNLENLHLLVSSRVDIAIKECLDPIATATVPIENNPLEGDITLHIQWFLQNDPKMRKWEDSLKRDIEISLVHRADGR